MRNYFSWIFPIILILLYVSNATAGEINNETKGEQCNAEWEGILSKYGNYKYEEILSEWLKLENDCKGTGVYEFRLSSTYNLLGNREKAKEITEQALLLDNSYLYLNASSKLNYQFMDLLESKSSDVKEYERIERGFYEISKDYSEWATIYEMLSGVQLVMGKVDLAIANAKKALEMDDASWPALRVLVIGYSEKGLHQQSQPLIVKAIKLNELLLADSEFMIMAALTYLSLNEVDTAKSVLAALLEREPEIRSDERFIKLVNHIRGMTE